MDVDFQKEKRRCSKRPGRVSGIITTIRSITAPTGMLCARRYRPQIEACRTPDEMRAILRLMIGELNSSHSGISGPAGAARADAEGAAARWANLASPSIVRRTKPSGRLRITEVLPLSPAEVAGKIQPGEELRAVDGVAIGAAHQSGRAVGAQDQQRVELSWRITLRIERARRDAEAGE